MFPFPTIIYFVFSFLCVGKRSRYKNEKHNPGILELGQAFLSHASRRRHTASNCAENPLNKHLQQSAQAAISRLTRRAEIWNYS